MSYINSFLVSIYYYWKRDAEFNYFKENINFALIISVFIFPYSIVSFVQLELRFILGNYYKFPWVVKRFRLAQVKKNEKPKQGFTDQQYR